MLNTLGPLLLAACLFVAMMVFLEIGRRMGVRASARSPKATTTGVGPLEGVVFSVFGLLVAFTFSSAPGRLETRKQLIADEVNAIGTAYLRVDLLAAEAQPAIRDEFRAYVDSRIEVYRRFPDEAKVRDALAKSAVIQRRIWADVLAATQNPSAGHPDAGKFMIPALNEMIDITTTRTMAAMIHVPEIIFTALFLFALLCSVLAGFGMAKGEGRSWIHMAAFAIVVSVTIYLVMEIEFPRSGLYRMDTFDRMLIDLRQDMG